MSDSLHYITCTGLTLCTDHGSSLVDTAECFTEISCTAHERNLEISLVDMVHIISR